MIALSLFSSLGCTSCYVLFMVAVALVVLVTLKVMGKETPGKDGVVYLYQYPVPPAWYGAPNSSNFCTKVEMFLVHHKIPYEAVGTLSTHPRTSKMPYIKFNGETVTDSNEIIEFLSKKFNINMDAHLTADDQAIRRAFQKLIEDSLYWAMGYSRWIEEGDSVNEYMLGIPKPIAAIIFPLLIQSKVRKALHGHGLGRMTVEQIHASAKADIDAIAQFLGDKKFFFGDKPSTIDLTLMPMIVALIWVPFKAAPHKEYIKKTHPQLERYCERVRDTLFPTWDAAIALARNGGKPLDKKNN